MRYVHPVSKKPLTGSLCIPNWIKTIDAFQHLWKILQEKGYKQFRPSYINQDPLENFFGCIRATGGRNINPTCTNFCSAYKVLLINNLSSRYTIGRNCEDTCNGKLLFSLRTFICETQENDTDMDEVEDECTDIGESSLEEMHASRHGLQDSSVYTALVINLLVKAPLKHCVACRASMIHSTDLQQTLQKAETLVKKCIMKVYFKSKIKNYIEREIEGKLHFTFIRCPQHEAQLKTAILSSIINTCLSKFCTAINRFLSGKYTSTAKNPIFIAAQRKYQSRIKKKRLITDKQSGMTRYI